MVTSPLIGDTLGFLIIDAIWHQSFRTRTFMIEPSLCSSKIREDATFCDLVGANRGDTNDGREQNLGQQA